MTQQHDDLNLPLGKRTPAYRFFEMLPGIISYGALIILVVLSIVSPYLAAIYLLLFIITMLVKAIIMARHAIAGHRRMKTASSIDWHQRLLELHDPQRHLTHYAQLSTLTREETVHIDNLHRLVRNPTAFPSPDVIRNAVIIAAYNEPYEVIAPTLDALVGTTYDHSKLMIIFAYEERGGSAIAATAERLKREYGKKFGSFMLVAHPANIPDEVKGKGPNISYAAQQLEAHLKKEKIPLEHVIVTTLDCDNKTHEKYFDYLTYEYIMHENRRRMSFQPLAIYFSNIWDAPAPMRVIAVGNSFWTIIVSMRPHLLRNFAAHSQPMDALADMDYWSKVSIVEDGHQYWRSYFFFKGDYEVVPIHVPIYQDAVLSSTLKATMVAQFKQLRRWAYGASDVPYVATKLFRRHRKVPFWGGLVRFGVLLDSHVTLAVVAIMVGLGAWVPLLINPDASRDVVVHNLPQVVGLLQRFAMIGLFVTIILTLVMLPPRPVRYGRRRSVMMVLQWFLMPITAIFYNSLAAFTAQTYLLTGSYLDKFDVTDKATYEITDKGKKAQRQAKK